MTTTQPAYRKKLIEVDLPLDAINAESAREKSIRHGHPSTLHLWWARRPLAACRAVIFASLVDDPSACLEEFTTPEKQTAERGRLHDLIRRLVVWENSSDERVLAEARKEIAKSVARSRNETAPTESAAVLDYLNRQAQPIYDPFCGGGSIPLEAQRLGLRAVGSDLNPVAVLITKALIELPPRFANQPPVNPEADPMGMTVGKGKREQKMPWRGAAGLADDIRYYGRQMRELAWERIGHLYPKAQLPDGSEATVIAWLWARTVPCPNPACGVAMPLMRTFQVSKKRGNEHWIRPVVDSVAKSVSFQLQNHRDGVPAEGTVNRNGATCVACGSTSPLSYVREQARAGNMGEVMTCIVAEGDRKRLFLSPTEEHIRIAKSAKPEWRPSGNLPEKALGFRVQGYGFTQWHQLFTDRQLTSLTTLNDLVSDVREVMMKDGASEKYANVLHIYLVLATGKYADYCSNFSSWIAASENVRNVFTRQALPMIWDFGEANPFANLAQNWISVIERIAEVIEKLSLNVNNGEVHQADASTTIYANSGPVIVTDPPYYDNIAYADLSDYFYIWLRPLLRDIYTNLFAGIVTPKVEEMIAEPNRFDDARQRFERLLIQTLRLIRDRCSPEFPLSIFYAYKQQEEEREGRSSTGWETMIRALVESGFQVIGTWPMHTERQGRIRDIGSNALASSVVLVCRPRPEDAPIATRRQFLYALAAELPKALDQLTREGHIAPVDLAQAAIGPGMQIYSRYRRVETISGEPVTVREALAAINQAIADYDERQEGELDAPTRFCVDWLKQYGYKSGSYGVAQTLAQAKNVTIEDTLRDTHDLLTAAGGEVQLLPVDAYGAERRRRLSGMTAWEGACRMVWHLSREEGQGIAGAAEVYRMMDSSVAESVERLARILYNHYDRKNDSANSVMFNSLVTVWPDIQAAARQTEQSRMNFTDEVAG